MRDAPDSAELFRHVSAEKSALYRNIMDSFAAGKRQFRLHLRPNEVLAECQWAIGTYRGRRFPRPVIVQYLSLPIGSE